MFCQKMRSNRHIFILLDCQINFVFFGCVKMKHFQHFGVSARSQLCVAAGSTEIHQGSAHGHWFLCGACVMLGACSVFEDI